MMVRSMRVGRRVRDARAVKSRSYVGACENGDGVGAALPSIPVHFDQLLYITSAGRKTEPPMSARRTSGNSATGLSTFDATSASRRLPPSRNFCDQRCLTCVHSFHPHSAYVLCIMSTGPNPPKRRRSTSPQASSGRRALSCTECKRRKTKVSVNARAGAASRAEGATRAVLSIGKDPVRCLCQTWATCGMCMGGRWRHRGVSRHRSRPNLPGKQYRIRARIRSGSSSSRGPATPRSHSWDNTSERAWYPQIQSAGGGIALGTLGTLGALGAASSCGYRRVDSQDVRRADHGRVTGLPTEDAASRGGRQLGVPPRSDIQLVT